MNIEFEHLKLDFKKVIKDNTYLGDFDLAYESNALITILTAFEMEMAHTPKTIIDAKFYYYTFCHNLVKLLKRHFQNVNPYVFDDEESALKVLCENYDELFEHIQKTHHDCLELWKLYENKIEEDREMKTFFYIRDLYIIGKMLNIIFED